VQQLAAGLGACGATLTVLKLHNRGDGKYRAPAYHCSSDGAGGLLSQLRIAHPATVALRLTHLLSSLPGLTTLDLRGLKDLAGPRAPWCCEYHCGPHLPRGFEEVFHVYAALGGLSSLRSLRLACDRRGNGLHELAASVDALAPSLRRLSITAAAPVELDYDSDDIDDDGPALEAVGAACIGRLTSLDTLELSGCPLPPPPEWLQPLTALTRLEADGCYIFKGEDLALLAGLPLLRELTLLEFSPEGEPMCAVAGVTRLACSVLRTRCDALLAAFPSLVEAVLRMLTLVPTAIAAPVAPPVAPPLGQHLRRLTARVFLPLAGAASEFNEDLAHEQLRQLLLGLPALRALHVAAQGTIGGAELPPLLHAAPALEELTLSGDLSTLDAAAFARCPRYPSLRALSLVDDGGRGGGKAQRPEVPLADLSSAGLLAIGRAFPALARLSLGPDIPAERRRGWWEALRRGITATGFCSDASLLRAVRRVLRREAARLARMAAP
jgi:hypothetical protein